MKTNKLLKIIKQKLKAQKTFYRFIDGNDKNFSDENICRVKLQEVYDHFEEWRVDWDMTLTQEEIKYLKKHPDILLKCLPPGK